MYDITFCCGALSGAITEFCLHPFDTVRARIQANSSRYHGVGEALWKITRREGPKALYRGFTTVLVFSAPAHALYYTTYDASKCVLPQWFPWLGGTTSGGNHSSGGGADEEDECPGFALSIASGVLADMAAELLWTPQDVIKQRQQILGFPSTSHRQNPSRDLGSYATLRSSLVAVYRQNGLRTFYTGYWVGVATCESAIYFTAYEQITHGISRLTSRVSRNTEQGSQQQQQRRSELSLSVYAVASFLASSFTAWINTPVDVLRTRLQIQGSCVQFPGHMYRGAWDALQQIWAKEGLVAFYKAVPARILYSAPNAMIAMVSFEALKRVFGVSKLVSVSEISSKKEMENMKNMH